MFRFFRSHPDRQEHSKKASAEKKQNRVNQKIPDLAIFPYAAVKITPADRGCCLESIDRSNIVYLRANAPLLPLDLCTNRYGCKCAYQHLEDRRHLEPRRESDCGLPDYYSGVNRRANLRDRRA